MKEKNRTELAPLHVVRNPFLTDSGMEERKPYEMESLIRQVISCQTRDCTGIVCIDTAGRVVSLSLAVVGTVTGTVRTLREIIKAALMNNAHQIVLFHSHCRGSASPTRSERLIAAKVEKIAALLGMKLLYHMVIATDTGTVGGISQMKIMDTTGMGSDFEKTS